MNFLIVLLESPPISGNRLHLPFLSICMGLGVQTNATQKQKGSKIKSNC